MNSIDLFPSSTSTNPTIYASALAGITTQKGLLKIGYTDRGAKQG